MFFGTRMIKRAGREASSAFRAVTCLEKRNGQEKTIKWLPFIRMGISSTLLTRGEVNSYNTTWVATMGSMSRFCASALSGLTVKQFRTSPVSPGHWHWTQKLVEFDLDLWIMESFETWCVHFNSDVAWMCVIFLVILLFKFNATMQLRP
jgi:hypothetical protein